MTGVAHLAGLAIFYNTEEGQVVRQRCSWCGGLMLEANLDRISVPEGQDPILTYPTWQIGAFIEMDAEEPGGNKALQVSVGFEIPLKGGTQVPDNACLRMPLDATK